MKRLFSLLVVLRPRSLTKRKTIANSLATIDIWGQQC